jgi:flagellar basal-body rod protein FlgC
MALFSALHTSGSGMRVFRTWIDAIADNLANVNTARSTDEAAFQARYVEAEAVQYGNAGQPDIGGGVRVRAIRYGDPEGRLVHDPSHPLADENGMVRMPDIDLAAQMTSLLMAQRAYQANVAVIERARDAYAQALQIGRS